MRKSYLLAAVAALTIAGGANAQTLTSARVNGASGAIWDTTANSFFTLFLQTPNLGNVLNPNDEAINFTPASVNNILLAGEGFPSGSTLNSDPLYTLTLNFSNGAQLTGTYNTVGNMFMGGTTTTVGNVTYSLTEFSYNRNLGDSVRPFQFGPGDGASNGNDYSGNFRFSAVAGAVPEPTTWAMMIGGFGLVGGAMRRRKTTAKISFA